MLVEVHFDDFTTGCLTLDCVGNIYVVYDGKLFCIPEFLTVFGHVFLHKKGAKNLHKVSTLF